MRRMRPGSVLPVLAVLIGLSTTVTARAAAPTASPEASTAIVRPCARDLAQGFDCITLTVPLDHFHETGRTTRVTFAIKRHTGEGPGKGVFVTATGGPGTSGIGSAVSYRDGFDSAIQRDYDVVFFDQRGAHLSGDLSCPDAAVAYYRSDATAAASSATTGLGADARAFVTACLAEAHADPSLLPYYSTRQAAEDLESIRRYLGADTIQLYGESYGSQLVQTYASAHPDRIAGLFVDGSVDLSLSLFDFSDAQVRAFQETLVGTLLDCTTQQRCVRDVAGADAWRAWQALEARLATGPAPYPFHRADGGLEGRNLTASDLLNAVSAYVYSEGDRMLLQRAIAAASQGDLWYLSRLVYAGLGIDPETQAAIPDPNDSDALYYAVECLDYAIPGDSPEARTTRYLAAGHDRGIDALDVGGLFYGDLPCAWWPAQPDSAARPPDLRDVPFPMFVLGATLDPATPWSNGEHIAAAAGDNAHVIVKPGGPHIIFGRGEACPDDIVTAFLEHGTLPAARRTVCPGDVAADYVALPPLRSTGYASTKAALASTDDEITTSADYRAWDERQPLTTGCRFGGTIRYAPTKLGSDLALHGCTWSQGLALSGSGSIDDDSGALTLRVTEDGRPGGRVRYQRDAQGRVSVNGELPQFADR